MNKIQIKQNPDDLIPVVVLAREIESICAGVRRLCAGRMNDRALLLLIQHSSKVSAKSLRAVIDGIENLERLYLRPKKVKP